MANNAPTEHPESLNRDLALRLILCAGLAIFWVVFLWNFWSKGVYALGFNAFIFLVLFLGLFVWVLRKEGHFGKNDLAWLIPFTLIVLSFALYDNPFLKIFSLMVLPAGFAIFYNQAFLPDKESKYWDIEYVLRIISRFFSFLLQIGKSATLYLNLIVPTGSAKKRIAVRVTAGLVLFLVIALTVFIPLLSSADAVFAERMKGIYDWFKEIISVPFMYKLLVGIALSILFSSVLAAWSGPFDYGKKEKQDKPIDSIVAGIVLGGILCLYALFLWVQVKRLWVGDLPFDFKETEHLVKSGFWQLLFLSVINILIYFFAYRKTSPIVQKILAAFTAASLLLLVSAGYRMGLYVTYYGFSYEKFFAAYTVLYCAIVFVWLITRLFIAQRSNILKFLVVLFIWMYAAVTVLPVEQFILRANVALSGIENSRIRLYELTMLSPDVLSLVKRYEQQGALKEKADYLEREGKNKSEEAFDWTPWIERQEKRVAEKVWYEMNIMNLMTRR
ncbi:MAG: DUF4153 domain-containing protein [Patescibacteria group bacterium]